MDELTTTHTTETTTTPSTDRRTRRFRRLAAGLVLAVGVAVPAQMAAAAPSGPGVIVDHLPGGDPEPGPGFGGPGDLVNPTDPGDPDPGPGFGGPGDLVNPTDPGDPDPGDPDPGEIPEAGVDGAVVATPNFTG